MGARPRIDLDGVALADASDEGMALAIFRYRTDAGLVLLMPESADFLVRWESIVDAQVDLSSGELHIQFQPEYVGRAQWLRGANSLLGRWTDRLNLSTDALALDL